MTISSATLLADFTLYIRDILRSSITDPIVSTRPSGEKFVMTSFPKRDVHYPLITIKALISNEQRGGQQSETAFVTMEAEVRAWARNEKEKVELTDSIYNYLRTNQYPTLTSNTSTELQLWDFKRISMVPVDDPGEEGIKSMESKFSYTYYIQ